MPVLILNIVETLVSFFIFTSNIANYPNGFLEGVPTTLEEIAVSKVIFISFLVISIFSIFFVRYRKTLSEILYFSKFTLYLFLVYLALWPLKEYWIISRMVYIAYYLFGITLLYKTYKVVNKKKK
jgi:hypothetical protein